MHAPWDHRRGDRALEDQEDYGQADYSQSYGYDPERRTGFRRDADDPYDGRPLQAYPEETRTWRGRPRDGDRDTLRDRRRLAADRRILAVISERLERDRRIDSSDVEITVENAVVYLNGTARTREGKRRIEHIADVDGVEDVVNGLRVREPETRRGLFGF